MAGTWGGYRSWSPHGAHFASVSPQVYERAVSNLPPATEKRYWQRYIYLWIKYALFEELDAEEPDRAREVYRACLKLIPHQLFTFSKVRTPVV